ncbi:PTS sugar transporter subunit IIA [Clostridium sp. Cult2]|uniref:PTS sugar transporter subunit IIA n=1 Tax=Clostridium sp. Cult2 TaxID=2079003 RepID=UPI001F289725|nr:PTS sugar transporter subunit IIA [Clostridium sp. Cult2]MCF6464950.1 PTS mannose transporter subunit IIAB [Clostridium sp. Cult2]
MIGILIVTHGKFGQELLESAELIVGELDKAHSIGLFPNESIDDFKYNIIESIKAMDNGKGVLVFADLYGGTPSNSIALNLDLNGYEINIECITGVNLPMLLEALTMRNNLNLSALKSHCIEAGIDGIKDLVSIVETNE